MLIHSRVLCDLCLANMGQVYGQPADSSGWAADFGMAPDYAVCPDCREPFAFEFARLEEAGQ